MPQFPATSYNYKHIATTTTTVVKALPGVLHGVFLNSGTSGAVITFYDNASAASGTVIAVITLGAGVTSPQARTLFDINFVNGLTILTATQVADLTVLYA